MQTLELEVGVETQLAECLLEVDEQEILETALRGRRAPLRGRQGLMTGPVQCDEAQGLVQLDQSV